MQSRTQIATAMALFALLGLGATKAWTLYSDDAHGQSASTISLPEGSLVAFRIDRMGSDSIFGSVIEPPFEATMPDANIGLAMAKAGCSVVLDTEFKDGRTHSTNETFITCGQTTDLGQIEAILFGADGHAGSSSVEVDGVYRLKIISAAELAITEAQ